MQGVGDIEFLTNADVGLEPNAIDREDGDVQSIQVLIQRISKRVVEDAFGWTLDEKDAA